MKKILKMTDEEIDQNFMNLIKEKQLVALADYYADKIGDDNKPLDFKSPLRLSGEEEEQNQKQEGGEEGGEGGPEEEPSEEPEAPGPANPGGEEGGNEEIPFGLGGEG